ncbi:ribose-5-phosphate isomerase [Desulfatibacillum alkenivorans DSM 16219]|uniref:Ribose-5-phosphate isomerase A n=1 Tax=Desulfatibacillum alkenivorans DSM 16219 TaxID=1121393 RepID=A0A1M6ZE11_9BACT|nr:ribose-5-phosphate isomerase RpiA [Desulfatibacillum alkenivorans]SHL28614.1 ribose-5-phosphate isomerase [Desulfatibacillum alkenivorans DSM 16219]
MTTQDALKKQAAEKAVEYLESGMVVGLGSGSTATFAIHAIARLMKEGKLKDIVGIPSSTPTEEVARSLGIPLVGFEEQAVIDVTIDGADEVDPDLNLIKGGGGALLREKVVAQATKKNIIIVDESKISDKLGTIFALPVEVVPFATAAETRYLESLGAKVTVRQNQLGKAFKTDNHNRILDADFGPMDDAVKIGAALSQRAGVVEHGLFLGTTALVIVAGADGIREMKAAG